MRERSHPRRPGRSGGAGGDTRGCPIERILREIEAALAERRRAADPPGAGPAPTGLPGADAAVSVVVRPGAGDLELLLIKRAERPGDPWSGHMAFPGGRAAADDATLLDTARRETLEEVGIDLYTGGRLLGRLDEVAPRVGVPPVTIYPFAFAVPCGTATTLNHEVERAVWIPIRALLEPGAAMEHLLALESGERISFPAIAYEELVIWGLTHRILTQLLSLVRGEERREESP